MDTNEAIYYDPHSDLFGKLRAKTSAKRQLKQELKESGGDDWRKTYRAQKGEIKNQAVLDYKADKKQVNTDAKIARKEAGVGVAATVGNIANTAANILTGGSAQSYEPAMGAPQQQPAGNKNILIFAGIGVVAIVVYFIYKRKKK